MPHGGKRTGAGHKKGVQNKPTIEKEAARAALRQIVLESMKELVSAQMANAMGLKYLVVRDKRTGKFERATEATAKLINPEKEIVEIWEKDPSIQAFTDLMNRAIDKPTEMIEQNHSGAITIKHEL